MNEQPTHKDATHMNKLATMFLASALAFPAMSIATPDAGAQDRADGATHRTECRHGHWDHADHADHGRHGGRFGDRGRHHGDPAQRATHRATMMTAILGLTPAQSTQVQRILLDEATARDAIRQQSDRAARESAMQTLHLRTKASIEALLDPTQRATFARVEAVRDAEHAERARDRSERGDGHGRPAPAASRRAPNARKAR